MPAQAPDTAPSRLRWRNSLYPSQKQHRGELSSSVRIQQGPCTWCRGLGRLRVHPAGATGPVPQPFFSATALGAACQHHTLTRRLQSHGAGLSKKKTSAPKPRGAASLLTKESGEAAGRLAASLPTLGARSRLSPRLQPLSRVFCTYPNYKQPERLPRGGKGTKREVMSLNQPAHGGRVKDLRDIGALMWLGESLLVTCWEFSPEPWFGASSGFKYCLGRVPEGNRSQTILNDQGT